MTAKPAEQFSANYFKPREYDHEKGRNVHVQIVIERHGDPQKDPLTGKSLDALTEKGVREEREKGATLEVPAGGSRGMQVPRNVRSRVPTSSWKDWRTQKTQRISST